MLGTIVKKMGNDFGLLLCSYSHTTLISTKLFVVVLSLLFICGCTNNGEREHMRSLLQQAQKQNQDYIPFTSDSIGKVLVKYYEHHGSSNDKMLAHYLLGSMYRDMKEAPMALQCFQDALEMADTTSSDCDYGLLCRINGQIAALLHKEYLPEQALCYNEQACHFAELDNDTITALIFREKIGRNYVLLHQNEKAISIFEDTSRRLLAMGREDNAAITIGLPVTLLIDKGDYGKAKQYMDIHETSSLFDENHRIASGKETFYVTKGRYYLEINQPDSAEYYFRTAISATDELNVQLYAHDKMLQLFHYKNNTDSIAKYAQLCYELDDSIFAENTRDILSNMNSLYQYGRSQKQAIKMEKEAGKNKLLFIISLFVILLLLLLAIISWVRYRGHQRVLFEKYKQDKNNLLATQNELLRLQEENYDSIIDEKIKYIETLKERIVRFEETHDNIHFLDVRFAESDICKKLHSIARYGQELPSKNDWENLKNLIDAEIPSFYAVVNHHQNLKEQEYQICMLIRTNFQKSEICNLMNMSSANLSMLRKRLLVKIFATEGSAKEFDAKVLNIF